ncbi:PIN domain-containing protein [Desulfonema limicola]|uniref:PIN domain-containing protein n=1 Tax=Desulfonema limicola TaxID=45656 RepID=A0A975GHH5_9BACT|nr:type II toxin-antitoxin system VapC family toxin [Desulfonema limicola]QTA81450.1 PIN domain-containing protein [Desulfonema limicola]
MKLLLDTHIILWSVSSPEKLSQEVFSELKKDSNELWYSPISAWEVILLAEKRRIILEFEASECFQNIIKELSLREAKLNLEVAIHSRKINLAHQDPADRFLAATAFVYGLKLVTSDERLIECDEIQIMSNN